MSRPRHAFGNQPGRLPATLLRALSAELSDPGRYRRAKDYARDGAVIEIDIRPGVVAGQVLGSRRDPYEVMIYSDAIDEADLDVARERNSIVSLIPERTELAVTCTCPDADGGMMCKHALAVLMVVADEVSIEPELLARWRSHGESTDDSPLQGTRLRSAPSVVDQRSAPRGATPPGRPEPSRAPAPPRVDVLARLLASPAPIIAIPELPPLLASALTTPPARHDAASRLLDAVIDDALHYLRR